MTRLRNPFNRHNVGAVAGGFVVVMVVTALVLANQNSNRKTDVQQTTQENVGKQLDALKEQLDQSEKTRRQLTADRERFQAQITASIDQLLQAGQQPIIVAPDAVSPEAKQPVATTTTTTAPPTVVTVPVPSQDDESTTTEPPPPPTTDAPTTTTTEPEPTTTTTEETPQ